MKSPFVRRGGIVVVVDRKLNNKDWRILNQDRVDFVEVRLDLFHGGISSAIAQIHVLRKKIENSKIKIIATYRNMHATQNQRMQTYNKIIPLADYLDIEYNSHERDILVDKIKTQRKKFILSTHDFHALPNNNQIEAVMHCAHRLRANIVKYAYTVNNFWDALRFINIMRKQHRLPLAFMAMGRYGKISRIVAPKFGSVLNYGYLFSQVAPGMLAIKRLQRWYRLLYI